MIDQSICGHYGCNNIREGWQSWCYSCLKELYEEEQQKREYRERDNQYHGLKCPECGSYNYSQGTYYEECHNCGDYQGY